MTTLQLLSTLGALAEEQHGLLTRSQARHLGMSPAAEGRARAAGALDAVTARVLRLAGTPPTFPQRCLAAVLDAGPGAVASHVTAAALWQLPGFAAGAIHISRPHDHTHRRSDLATVHLPRLLAPHHSQVLDGVPVTTVARTVFDLAGCLHPQRSERALDNALARHSVQLEDLRRITVELQQRGRPGSALMRAWLAARRAGYIPPASGLEARFLALVAAAGIELPEGQVDLGGEAWIGRVDHFFRNQDLVVEVDSERHHSSQLDRASDTRRDEALRAAGYRVLRVGERELAEAPAEVISRLRAALKGASTPPGGPAALATPRLDHQIAG